MTTSDLQALRSDQCASAGGAVPAVSIGGVSPRSRLSSCASTPVTAERAGSPPSPGRPQHGTEAHTWPRGKAATGRWHREAWGCHREAGPGSHEHAAVPSLLSRLAAAAAEPSAAFARAALSKPSSSRSRAARGLAGASFLLDPLALRRLGGEGLTRVGSAS